MLLQAVFVKVYFWLELLSLRGPTRAFDPHLDQVQILCMLLVRVPAAAASLGLGFLIYKRTALQWVVEMTE